MSSDHSVPGTCVDKAPTLPIRIVLVDDHAILRESLKALIATERDLIVVAEFDSVDAILAAIGTLQPDLILTDLAFPERSGIELLEEARRLAPRTKMLVLTGHDSERYIRSAINAGANGYVLKDTKRSELMQAIRTVASGEQFLCASIENTVLRRQLNESQQPEDSKCGQSITRREREVVIGIASGYSNNQIAHQLGVSPKTVQKHRANLMRKLGLHNISAVTRYAMRNGLARGEKPSDTLSFDGG